MPEEKQKRTRKPSVPASTMANAEIDSRLAQAIRDRAKAMQMVSKLVHWQDRLNRLEQEINSLIGFQQRLSGQVDRVDIYGQSADGRITSAPIASALPGQLPSPFSHLNPIPVGVTSIPTKTANPKPSGGNVADIAGEGGFS
jgi:hypothetical protein